MSKEDGIIKFAKVLKREMLRVMENTGQKVFTVEQMSLIIRTNTMYPFDVDNDLIRVLVAKLSDGLLVHDDGSVKVIKHRLEQVFKEKPRVVN